MLNVRQVAKAKRETLKTRETVIFKWITSLFSSTFLSEAEWTRGEGTRGSSVDGIRQSPTEPEKDPLSDPEQGCKLLKCYWSSFQAYPECKWISCLIWFFFLLTMLCARVASSCMLKDTRSGWDTDFKTIWTDSLVLNENGS